MADAWALGDHPLVAERLEPAARETRRRLGTALEAHVAELCATHGISWITTRRYAGGASRRRRIIRTPRVRGQVSYLIALHEIAHVVGPVHSHTLENEAECWRWALDASLVVPTPRARRSAARRLLDDLRRALERRPEDIPPPDAPFWHTLWALEPDLKRRYDRHAAELAGGGASA
jgi:hypothetical protein